MLVINKYIITILMLTGLLFVPLAASADDLSLSQFIELLIKLGVIVPEKVDQARLLANEREVKKTCHTFARNLRVGDRGSEVRFLLQALEKEGFEIRRELDEEEEYIYDDQVASAVTGFQQKYASEILAPLSLKYGTGFLGGATRTKLNKLYGCIITITPSDIVQPTVIPQATGIPLSAVLISTSENRAGPNWVFAPGNGSPSGFGGGVGNDYRWRATLALSESKTIKSMLMAHNVRGEAWSTSGDTSFLGKHLYPLVVFSSGGSLLNSDYDQVLGTYSGTVEFDLYGQIESAPFAGGTLYVYFTDGTVAKASVPRSPLTITPVDGVNLWLYEAGEDQAGTVGVFSPGAGASGSAEDWKWKIWMTIAGQKEVKSFTIYHNVSGEFWSTSKTSISGKEPYSLVVFRVNSVWDENREREARTKLNTAYDVPLGISGSGHYLLTAFGQRETSSFAGGKLVVEFTDGTSIYTTMPAFPPKPSVSPLTNVSEEVKCVFNGATAEQKCYTAVESGNPRAFGCSGIGACVVSVNGPRGTSLTWKSSCGGYANTTIDGYSEYANFICSSTQRFQIGDRVQTTQSVSVYNGPSLTDQNLGTQATGATGVITGGGNTAWGYTWWNVNFDSGVDGWVPAQFLAKTLILPSSITVQRNPTITAPFGANPGSVNARIGSYTLTNPLTEAVRIPVVTIKGGNDANQFVNVKVLANGRQFGSTQGVFSAGTAYTFAVPSAGEAPVISAGGSLTFDVYADVLSSAPLGTKSQLTSFASCSAVGLSTLNAVPCGSAIGHDVDVITGPQPTITVLSPNGGEVAPVGGAIKVSWTSSGVPAGVQVLMQIWKGANVVYSSYTDNDGYETFVVPSAIGVGNDYTLGILYKTSDGTVYGDRSDGPFTITSGTILQYQIGDRVQTTQSVSVYNGPSLTDQNLGTQATGATGVITSGGNTSFGYTWWNVNFDSGADGWVIGSYLTKTATTQPSISSVTPSSGSIGAKVTIVGVGFKPTNTVHFYRPGEFTATYIPSVSSSDGQTLTFIVPEELVQNCPIPSAAGDFSSVPCPKVKVLPGNYKMYLYTGFGGGTSNLATFNVTATSLSVIANTDEREYSLTEPIRIYITARNNSDVPITLRFSSGCQVSYSTLSFNSEQVAFCIQVPTSVEIQGGANKTWALTHDQVAHPLTAADHILTARILGYGEATTTVTILSSTY